jgi:hypothetical protein
MEELKRNHKLAKTSILGIHLPLNKIKEVIRFPKYMENIKGGK